MKDTGRITRAIDATDGEIRAIQTEIEAFVRFRERLRPLAIASNSAGPTEETETDHVVDIYRETVVATDDFDSAYRESRREHMVSEFGSGFASRLERADHLTGELKRGLLAATERAVASRERLVAVLETERASLHDANETLTEIDNRLEGTPPCSVHESSLETVIDTWQTLERLADDCAAVADRRQRFLIERRELWTELEEPTQLDAYLYTDLDSIHPVLRTVTEVAGEIEARKSLDSGSTVTAPEDGHGRSPRRELRQQ